MSAFVVALCAGLAVGGGVRLAVWMVEMAAVLVALIVKRLTARAV